MIGPKIHCGTCSKPYRTDVDVLSGKEMQFRACRHPIASAVATCPACSATFGLNADHSCAALQGGEGLEGEMQVCVSPHRRHQARGALLQSATEAT